MKQDGVTFSAIQFLALLRRPVFRKAKTAHSMINIGTVDRKARSAHNVINTDTIDRTTQNSICGTL
jgi:hypothetical protein